MSQACIDGTVTGEVAVEVAKIDSQEVEDQ